MNQHLIFQLYAPMTAWGRIAVGETRPTDGLPSRSALLGLLAAALGIPRDNEILQNRLSQHYHFAIRVFRHHAYWLEDYHTTQVPPEQRKVYYATRRDELSFNPLALSTILSTREYHSDIYYHIVVSETEQAPYSIAQLKQALEQPLFPLFLGRKSCPPAISLWPQLVSGSLAEAFSQAHACYLSETQPMLARMLRYLGYPRAKATPESYYFWEQPNAVGMHCHQQTVMQDQPVSRLRRQFCQRTLYQGQPLGEC